MLVTMILNVSCATTSQKRTEPIHTYQPRVEAAPSCDELLDECAILANKQHEAIAAQQVVIDKQDQLIEVQQEEIDNEGSQKNLFLGIAVTEGLYILLKAVIGF